jgi:integrase
MMKGYTFDCPLRNELASLRILSANPKADNFVKMSTDRSLWVFNVYKTSGKFGRNELVISDDPDLYEMVKLRLETAESDYLFQNGCGEMYSTAAWSQHVGRTFQKYVGKPLTCTMLRKSFHTWLQARADVELAELTVVARRMGHSESTARKYRRLVDADPEARIAAA